MDAIKKGSLERSVASLLLAGSFRESIDKRCELAERAWELAEGCPDVVEGLLCRLARDSVPVVRESVGRGLARLLEHSDCWARTRIVSEWAGGSHPSQRTAIASALRNRIPVLGALSVLEALSRDSYAEVRRAVCEAVSCRMEDAPRRCTDILIYAAHDNRRSVRIVAIDGLQKAVDLGVWEDAIDMLIECADDDDVICAEHAVDAMVSASVAPANRALHGLEILVAHPEDHDPEVIRHVIDDVTRLGCRSRTHDQALRVLRKLENHPIRWVQNDAHHAVEVIEPSTPPQT